MRLHLPYLILTTAMVGGQAASSLAGTTERWTVRSQAEWQEGKGEGLRIEPSGQVSLARSAELDVQLEESVVWAVAPGPEGSVWVGTGSGGRLLRIAADGSLTVAAEFAEPQVTALLAAGDAVYAATSPDGAIYRVRGGETEPEELGRPGATYIWSLAVSREGTLYAGTGVDGTVYAVRDGSAEAFYKVPDTHVVSLLSDGDGGVYAGTAERGLVLHIVGPDRASVVYDSDYKEVKALVLAPGGELFAAVNGGASFRDTGAAQQPPGEATVTVKAEAAPAQGQAQTQLTLAPPEALGEISSEVVRIAPDLAVDTISLFQGEIVQAMAATDSGAGVIVGTSKRLLVPAGLRQGTATITIGPECQVSSLAVAGKRLLVGTTGPSRILVLAAGRSRKGIYTSKVLAANAPAQFGRLDWDGAAGAGTGPRFETRSGATREPDETWSDWTVLPASGEVASPAARFLQWRVELVAEGNGSGPLLRSVSVAYRERNRRPLIKSFQAHPPGVVFQRAAAGPNLVENVPPPLPSMFSELAPASPDSPAGGKRLYRRGAETLTWEVSDPDSDDLDIKLTLRSRDGGPDLLVRERPETGSFSFDTEVLPDGWYVARIEVSDAPSNGPGSALTVTRDSEAFLVDNTPPAIRRVDGGVDGKSARVRFAAEDATSALWKAEWSLDGVRFRPIDPVDGQTDGRTETYELVARDLAPGEHFIVLRVYDLAGQTAAAGETFRVRR